MKHLLPIIFVLITSKYGVGVVNSIDAPLFMRHERVWIFLGSEPGHHEHQNIGPGEYRFGADGSITRLDVLEGGCVR